MVISRLRVYGPENTRNAKGCTVQPVQRRYTSATTSETLAIGPTCISPNLLPYSWYLQRYHEALGAPRSRAMVSELSHAWRSGGQKHRVLYLTIYHTREQPPNSKTLAALQSRMLQQSCVRCYSRLFPIPTADGTLANKASPERELTDIKVDLGKYLTSQALP